jgi:hypothetical protein
MSQSDFDDVLLDHAVDFLQSHLGSPRLPGRHWLLEHCAAHLRRQHNIGATAAQDIAIRAYGKVSSVGVREYFDLSRSTSSVIALRDPGTGLIRMVTVADLLRMIGPARHAPPRLVATTH